MDKESKDVSDLTVRKGLGKKLVEMFELPEEVVFNLPIIQAIGTEDISITNYKGLAEYSGECVRINTATGSMRFDGTGLVLKHVTSETVAISGRINKIEFLR